MSMIEMPRVTQRPGLRVVPIVGCPCFPTLLACICNHYTLTSRLVRSAWLRLMARAPGGVLPSYWRARGGKDLTGVSETKTGEEPVRTSP